MKEKNKTEENLPSNLLPTLKNDPFSSQPLYNLKENIYKPEKKKKLKDLKELREHSEESNNHIIIPKKEHTHIIDVHPHAQHIHVTSKDLSDAEEKRRILNSLNSHSSLPKNIIKENIKSIGSHNDKYEK